jgi:hypothetical protein
LWNFKGKDIRERTPRMIIFDTKSTHLTNIRSVNHKKILKKMKEPSKDQMFFNFQAFMPQ